MSHLSVCVFFRYTSNLIFPSSFLINRVSKNGICPSVSSPYVNRMLPVESTEFRCSVSCVTLPLFITPNVSSTNLFHSLHGYTIHWRCSYCSLLQPLHEQVCNYGRYWTSHCCAKSLLIYYSPKGEVRCGHNKF